MGNNLILCLDPYQKIEGILSKAGFTGFYAFFLRPDHHGESPLSSTGLIALCHCFRLKSGRGSKAAKRLGDLQDSERGLRLCQSLGARVEKGGDGPPKSFPEGLFMTIPILGRSSLEESYLSLANWSGSGPSRVKWAEMAPLQGLSLIHISEPTRL